MKYDPRDIPKPKFFYKYSKISDHSFEQIKESYLWFSEWENLNDPFDLKYVLSNSFMDKLISESSKRVRSDFLGLLQEEGYQFPPELANEIFDSFNRDEQFKKETNEFIFAEVFKYKICCFTASSLNKLMWAHYGDGHKGICYKYDFSESPETENYILPVRYSEEYPKINSVDDLPTEGLLRKSKEWEYEKEWRVIDMVGGKRPIEKSCLKGVIFGCKTNPEDIKKLKNCFEESDYEIEYNKIIIPERSYDLKLVSC